MFFLESVRIFLNPNSSKQNVIEAGERALLKIYGLQHCASLDKARILKFKEKTAAARAYVEPQTLPPTSASAKFHSLRVFYQVHQWISECSLSCYDWGWHETGGKMLPIMTDRPPAPQSLLKIVRCSCRTDCRTARCSCRRHGLVCTDACLHRSDVCSNKIDLLLDNTETEMLPN